MPLFVQVIFYGFYHSKSPWKTTNLEHILDLPTWCAKILTSSCFLFLLDDTTPYLCRGLMSTCFFGVKNLVHGKKNRPTRFGWVLFNWCCIWCKEVEMLSLGSEGSEWFEGMMAPRNPSKTGQSTWWFDKWFLMLLFFSERIQEIRYHVLKK